MYLNWFLSVFTVACLQYVCADNVYTWGNDIIEEERARRRRIIAMWICIPLACCCLIIIVVAVGGFVAWKFLIKK